MSARGLFSRLGRLWGRGEPGTSESRRRAVLEGVEARLLYSADLAPGLTDDASAAWQPQAIEPEVQLEAQHTATALLAFEQNVGQAQAGVDFLARGSGYAALLGAGNATLAFERAGQWTTLRLALEGGQTPSAATAEDMLASRSNYLVGAQENWHTDIANYGAVRYDGVYDGVALRYYGQQQGLLEYDFVLDPGADADRIAWRFEGAGSLAIADNGDLVIGLGDTGESVRFHAPVSYQMGPNGREAVDSHYVIREDGSVGFALGAYDHGRTLVIDPTLDYGTYLGGTGTEAIRDLVQDSAGNMYATGSTTSSASFATVGDVTYNGSTDAFVARYASSGALSWITYYGGNSSDIGYGIDVDSSGNAYIAGQTDSTDLPTPNGAATALGAGSSGFLARFNASGTAVTYGTYGRDGGYRDVYYDVVVNDFGRAYVTGSVGLLFSAAPEDTQILNVVRYETSVSGSASLIGSLTNIRSWGDTWGRSIEMDSDGSLHVVGTTTGGLTSTLPSGTWQSFYGGGNTDGFLARFGANLSWNYFTYIGGSGDEQMNGLAVDSAGRTVVVGTTTSSGMSSPGAYDSVLSGNSEAYVAKFDMNVSGASSRLFGSYYSGGFGTNTTAYAVAVMSNGNIAVTGSTTSTTMQTTADAVDATAGGGTDAFLAVFNASGSSLVYGSYVGGTGADVGYALVTSGKSVVIAGQTASDGLSTAGGADTSRSGTDGFLQRYGFNAVPTVVAEAVTTISGETALYAFEPGGGSNASLVAGAPAMSVQSPVTYSSSAGRATGSYGLLFTSNADSSTNPVSLSSIPNVASTQAITFSAWVRFDQLDTTEGWERIFDFGAGSANNNVYLTRQDTTNNIQVGVFSGNSFADALVAPNFLSGRVGQWFHAAVTLDSDGELFLYLNGAAIGSVVLPATPNMSTWTRNYIGSSNWTENRQFRGAMDDIAIFDRALTAAEVLALSQTPAASASLPENSTAGTTVFRAIANDADAGDTLTYSLTNNAGGRFAINASTGVVTVASGAVLDREATPSLSVVVRATDSSGGFDEQTFTISLTDVNEFNVGVLSDIDPTANAVTENAANGTTVGITANATDADSTNNAISYSLSNSAGGRFAIGTFSGVVSVANGSLIDRESAASHTITVVATSQDGSSSSQSYTINVAGANEFAPVITSNGGGASAAVSVVENSTAVTTVVATDADVPGQTLVYSIAGGADAARFSIDAATGALRFVAAPNYEAPTDANTDNVYAVTVQASDGSFTDTQAIAVTVTPVNDAAPVITSNGGGATASVNVAENTTAVTTVTATDGDQPAQVLTYSIAGGADAALFSIDAATGALSFLVAPDREAPGDANADDVYEVTVRASDGSLTDTQAIAVTVTAVNEHAPAITSDGGGATASVAVADGATAVTWVTASDADVPGQTLSYAIVGGADAALFGIDAATGALSFNTPPDFFAPADAGADNTYDVIVQASDGSLTDTQAIAVTVTVNNLPPVITSDGGGATASVSVAESGVAVTTVIATDADVPAQTVTYSIVGGADAALFVIDAGSGVLRFASAPDFEAPGDADTDNVYDVTVQASDGVLADTQSIAVTVTAVNDQAPVITSDGGGATASLNIAENATAVTSVAAGDTDLPAQALTYSIVGGADAALFSIDAVTGVLSFNAAPDRETPLDAGADNVYDVTVQASDGSLVDTQAIAVTVTAVNEHAPAITSDGGGATASVGVAENATAVTTVSATDADLPAQALTYSIVGGADAALFSIDGATGALGFVAAPDYEAPADANADNVYDVIVQVSDGTHTDSQAIAVTVTSVDEQAPVITSDGGGGTASLSVSENLTAVTTVTATDADLPAQALTYSIVGGADAARFSIDAVTGVLRFVAAPDYEAPADANADNVYDVTVQVSDGTLTDTQAMAVTVTAVNEQAPAITSDGGGATASVSVAENDTAVTTVSATDGDLPAQTLTYSIVGGADAVLFSIDAATGALRFVAPPDYEAPADANADNVYDLTVQVSDGTLADTQAIAVTVTAVNEQPPVITSDGGGTTASVSVAENVTAVTTVVATDGDLPAQALTYSIVGGADAALFSIDAASGALSFVAAPDYEAPADADADNVYDVTVQVSDGGYTQTQAIAVAVTAVNDLVPVITSNGAGATASVNVAENATAVTTVTATDADVPAQTLTYSIVGGADAAHFSIDAVTGALSFVAAPDYEAPADANTDNVYDVTVQASDGSFADTQAIAVTVTPVNEHPPAITSDGGGATASVSVAENATAVTTVAATDGDLPAQTMTYSIVGGADAALFTINAASGALSFVAAPDYEAPADANADNIYDVTVQASDGTLSDTQAIAVAITPVNDLVPVITSNGAGATASVNVAENTTAVTTVTSTDADVPAQTLTYSIVGGADAARFSIDAATGALRFVAAPDYEAPADANADNVYDVTVQASDGNFADTQAIAVTVTPVNDLMPLIMSDGGGATASVNLAENATAVTTVAATDGDLPAQTLTYSIVGGADAARFSIDAATGALSFVVAPDYEAPADANADNVYDVTVQATDGTLSDTQAIAVAITPVNDLVPVITSNGAGATASVNVAENATAVTTMTATDADVPAQTLTYSIVGGADAARFSIDAATGALRFVAAPDYEAPADANADNVYDVTVQASDGNFADTQAIAVTVTPVNDIAPVIASDGGGATASVSVAENATAVTTVAAIDGDLPAQTLTYSIVGGADAARFSIDAATGVLRFVAAPDYEAPADANADNVYDVTVRAGDGTLNDTQAIAVTVTAVNEAAPVITSNGGGATASVSLAENTAAVTTVTATDMDLPAQALTYSIVGGADAARFSIDATTGALRFVAAPDYESPADANTDNVYDVTVQASDGNFADTQAIAVTITPVNDQAPVITSDGGGADASVNVAENATAVTKVVAIDGDRPAPMLGYSIIGGADAGLFSIDPSTGVLRFNRAPDFESPRDADADNVYDVTVQATDGTFVTSQNLSVTVTDVKEVSLDIPAASGDDGKLHGEVVIPLPDGTAAQDRSAADIAPRAISVTAEAALPSSATESTTAGTFSLRSERAPASVQNATDEVLRSSRASLLAEEIAIKAWWVATQATVHNHVEDDGEWRVASVSALHPPGEDDQGNSFDEWVVHAGIAGLSASLTWWTSRSTSLLATMLASVRAWQSFDLLPVLKGDDDKKERQLVDDPRRREEQEEDARNRRARRPKTAAMQLEVDE